MKSLLVGVVALLSAAACGPGYGDSQYPSAGVRSDTRADRTTTDARSAGGSAASSGSSDRSRGHSGKR